MTGTSMLPFLLGALGFSDQALEHLAVPIRKSSFGHMR